MTSMHRAVTGELRPKFTDAGQAAITPLAAKLVATTAGNPPVADKRGMEAGAAETPELLMRRVSEFKASVHSALARNSQAYTILHQIEESGLGDCVRCTRELEARLAGNPHYIVLGKLVEAEQAIARLGFA